MGNDGFSSSDEHLLALCAIPHIGAVTARRLLRAFGTAREVFSADMHAIMEVEGISDARAGAIKEAVDISATSRSIKRARRDGVRVVAYGEAGYPEPLEALGQDAPVFLYMRGAWHEDDRHALAIVGSRKATDYGLKMAGRVARELGSAGLTITSGMAMGVDAEAHRGAIEGRGRTVAVLGSGIDVIYPAANRTLMKRIERAGVVMTEFPPGARADRINFPVRNRLISALSLGVLVVEAAVKSGSLITAEHAIGQGKVVFALPGNADSEYSKGANELIRRGARMVTEPEQILEDLRPLLKGFVKKKGGLPRADISAGEQALCKHLSGQPVQVDDLARLCGMPVAKTLSMLSMLELKGVVKQASGKRFYLA